MGKSFVYNAGSSDDDKKPNELRLEFGIFIDGTLNNKSNTEARRKYRKEDEKSIINKGSEKDEADLKKEAKDRKKADKNNLAPVDTEKGIYQRYLLGIDRDFIDKQGTDNSYSNDYTNVARMWNCSKTTYAIYVEGMGTGDLDNGLEKDSQDGFAFGSGLTGIRNRVRTACKRIVEKIKVEKDTKKYRDSKITQITLDVFGFSRGAASARNFVYEVSKGEYPTKEIEIPYLKSVYIPEKITHDEFGIAYTEGGYYGVKPSKRKAKGDDDGLEIDTTLLIDGKIPRCGYLGYCLYRDTDITAEELEDIKIIIRFVGLYDTVSSYYEVGALGSFKEDGTLEDDGKFNKLRKEAVNTHFDNDEEELNLQLDPKNFEKLVHFTAKDEHRRNFSLTRINQMPGKAIEKNFPGVHCDIGGAYENGEEVIDEIGTNISDQNYLWETIPLIPILVAPGLKSLREGLIEQYWYKKEELEINFQYGLSYKFPFVGYDKLTGTRNIRKEYSYIPLHFMEEYARTTGMNAYFKDKIELKYPVVLKDIKFVPNTDYHKNTTLYPENPKIDFPFKVEHVDNKFLQNVKDYLHNYVFDEDNEIKEWEFISDAELEKRRLESIEKEKQDRELEKIEKELKDGTYLKDKLKVVQDNLRSEYYVQQDLIIKSYDEPVFPKEDKVEDEANRTVLKEIVLIGYEPQKMLRQLRHEFIHWSSNRDWFGMEPNDDRKRRFFPKNK